MSPIPPRGEVLEIYGMGLLKNAVIPPQATIGGRAAEVLFFGEAPGFPELSQINVRVPPTGQFGNSVPLWFSYFDRPSNQVTNRRPMIQMKALARIS